MVKSTGIEDETSSYCGDEDIDRERFDNACPLVPGIVVRTTLNPCKATYQTCMVLCDGGGGDVTHTSAAR